MRKLFVGLLILVLCVVLCAAAAAEGTAEIILPEDVELPEDLENPNDPVELGSWCIPFKHPGDTAWLIYAHTEDCVYLGLALYEPEDPEAETIVFPEGIETILPGFFEKTPNVKRAVLPASVNNLSMQCFEGVHRDFVIECVPGSYAEAFALEYGFQYDNGEKQVIGWTITDPQEKIKWIVANYVREDMTEREKALVLHNWLTTNSYYHKGNDEAEVYESKTILTKGYGVCEAYAFAYYYLLQEANMAGAWFSGGALPEVEGAQGHEWNLVRVDGQWYHVDCTWDDGPDAPLGSPCVRGEKEVYFLLTDEEMAKTHTWESDYSADNGKMFCWWDPETKQEMKRSSWNKDFTYVPADQY